MILTQESGRALTPVEALKLLLGHVDYAEGACRSSDPVGSVVPEDVLDACRAAVAGDGGGRGP